jgi:hypothetical protein
MEKTNPAAKLFRFGSLYSQKRVSSDGQKDAKASCFGKLTPGKLM